MISRYIGGASLITAILASSSAAHAQQQTGGLAVNHFEPSERGSEWFVMDSLDFREGAALGAVGDWSRRPLVLRDPAGNLVSPIVNDHAFIHFGASGVLWNRLRLSANVPLLVHATGNTVTAGGSVFTAPGGTAGIGDLRLSADVRLAGQYGGAGTLAFGLSIWAPTGDAAEYTGDEKVRFAPRLQLAGDAGPIAYAIKVGAMIRGLDEAYGTTRIGSNVFAGASLGLRVFDRNLVIGPEIWGHTVVSKGAAFTRGATPVEALLGLHYTAAKEFRFGLGGGLGLTEAIGSPAWRGLVSLEWVPKVLVRPDSDRDTVFDDEDACPQVPGVRTYEPKTNGCPPPPPDRDGDGVLDNVDACPEVAGVRTSDPKTNGCPPPPPPPPDRDGDGVMDSEDACPDVAGVRTDDPHTNGCPPPDPDRDKDGILNDVDACPDEAGKPDPDPKKNGCPKAFIQAGQIRITDQVKFKTNSAQILPGKDSDEILVAVLKVMQAHAEVKGIRVEGHTDNVGKPAYNKKLSEARAMAVKTWLLAHGVTVPVDTVGFGLEKPIDTNDTPEGRTNNRRVEFHILDTAGAAAVPATKPGKAPKP